MSLYRRSKTSPYYYCFEFNGVRYRESTKSRNREIAERIERERRRELELGTAGLHRPVEAQTFAKAAAAYLDLKRPTLAAQTLRFEQSNLKHLLPVFGKKSLAQITAQDIAAYQTERRKAHASPRTVNMEVGTLRAILKRSGHWAALLPDVKMLKVAKSKGKVLPHEVAKAILEAASHSRSRSLYPFVVLAAETGSRYGTLKHLRWENIDFRNRCLQFGKDKTAAGSDREIPLSPRALACLEFWATNFPDRKPHHFVFPYEKCGGGGHLMARGHVKAIPYATDPTFPIGSMKTAWNAARVRAARILAGDPDGTAPIQPVPFRMHDFRHTAYTQMRNRNVPLDKIGRILGWSDSQMVRMAAIYGHFTTEDLREGVDSIGYD